MLFSIQWIIDYLQFWIDALPNFLTGLLRLVVEFLQGLI